MSESFCESCSASLGNTLMDVQVYCIPCIEEMERLGMSPGQYRKSKAKPISGA